MRIRDTAFMGGVVVVLWCALPRCGTVLPCSSSSQCAADESCVGGRCRVDAAPGSSSGYHPPAPYSGGGGGTSQPTSGSGGGTTSSHGVVDCPSEARIIYTVDQDGRFSGFDPASLAFHDVGILSCPSTGTPFSMAVSRSGTAYVVYNTGELFTVNIRTAACTATAFVPDQNAMHVFGMGFSTDTPGSTAETLFLAGAGLTPDSTTPSPLATLDLHTFTVVPRAMVSGSPELTGRSDATLWSFSPGTNPRVVHVDKQSGNALSTFNLPTLAGIPTAYAFASWGGAFWVFLASQGQTTTVHRVDALTGALTSPLPGTGRNIVGAGVATCAPLQ